MSGESGGIVHHDAGLRRLERRVLVVRTMAIKGGLQGRSGLDRPIRTYPSGRVVRPDISMADLGSIHHYGTRDGKVPAREWANMQDVDKWRFIARRLVDDIHRGVTPEKALTAGALRVQAKLRQQLNDVQEPPLAPRTLADRRRRRGDTTANPLIDTGELLRAITAVGEINGTEVVDVPPGGKAA